jgi:hypothetical protein
MQQAHARTLAGTTPARTSEPDRGTANHPDRLLALINAAIADAAAFDAALLDAVTRQRDQLSAAHCQALERLFGTVDAAGQDALFRAIGAPFGCSVRIGSGNAGQLRSESSTAIT